MIKVGATIYVERDSLLVGMIVKRVVLAKGHTWILGYVIRNLIVNNTRPIGIDGTGEHHAVRWCLACLGGGGHGDFEVAVGDGDCVHDVVGRCPGHWLSPEEFAREGAFEIVFAAVQQVHFAVEVFGTLEVREDAADVEVSDVGALEMGRGRVGRLEEQRGGRRFVALYLVGVLGDLAAVGVAHHADKRLSAIGVGVVDADADVGLIPYFGKLLLFLLARGKAQQHDKECE